MPHRLVPRRRLALALTFALSVLLSSCATVPGAGALSCDDAQNDPFERVNRSVFAFDLMLDRVLIKPAAKLYRAVLPEFVRDRIHDIVDNLKQPLVFANDVLQGRGHAAGITGRRFLVNSTIGLAGLTDRATGIGLPRQSGDFGQTLFAWGLGDGPYLVLPFFGPSNVRDTIGLGVDFYASPVGRIGGGDVPLDMSISTSVADGLDLRSRNIETLDELEASSLDFYAYLRSITRQQRQAVLREATAASGASSTPVDDLVDPAAPAPPVPISTARDLPPSNAASDPCAAAAASAVPAANAGAASAPR